MEQQTTITEELQVLINNKLESNPFLTISSLETEDISRKTIDRISKGQTKKTSSKVMLECLRALNKNLTLKEIFQELSCGAVKDTLESILNNKTDLGKKSFILKDSLNELISNPEYTELVMTILVHPKKLTKEDIKEYFGRSGVIKIERLEKSGINLLADVENFDESKLISQEASKHIFSYLVANYLSNKDEFHVKRKKWHTLDVKAVNKEKVYGEVTSILNDAQSRVIEILNKEENVGNDLIYLGTVFDSFAGIEQKEEK